MKRLILPVLLALLLCGCGGEPQTETTAPTIPTVVTEPTEPVGIYVPGSEMEVQTSGAVRMYVPSTPDTSAMVMQGSDILLFSGLDATTLTKLSGDNLFTIATAQLGCTITPEDPSFQLSEKGITYYDEQARAVVFLDNDLKEVNRIGVPKDLVGRPVLSSNRLKLYYCTAEAVRVLDLETGLDKLLKYISYPEQTVEGILLDDTVLQCSIADTEAYTIFISAQTGELVWETRSDMLLSTGQELYYATIFGGNMEELVFGVPGEEPRMLIPADAFADTWYLETVNAVVTVSEGGMTEYYDLESGLRTASVELPGEMAVRYVEAAAQSGTVYLMGYDAALEQEVIYGWAPEKTAAGDETVYTGPRYTLENPDQEGLTACAEHAARLSTQYGMEVLVGLDAVQVQPWDYVMETEYQVPVIERELRALEEYLSVYPDGFFETMGTDIRICLVRSLRGSAESGSLETAMGIQFWESDTAYVALAAGNSLEMTLYHELFHVVDNYVLSECSAYYDWEGLNPQGFTYDFAYISDQERDVQAYLEDETRAFIDAYSMSYPKEDRARIMEYAATAGHEHYFQSETMQEKLRTLCKGIREAFDLRQYPNELIWEQYLNEPLI